MPKLPFIRFYPSDYIIATRALTDTEKAIWVDLLCFMWMKEHDRGILEMHIDDLTRMLGRDRLTVSVTLNSLLNKGICQLFWKDDAIVKIESRRMKKEAKLLRMNSIRQHRYKSSSNGFITHKVTPKMSDVISQMLEDRRKRKNTDHHQTTDDGFLAFWEKYPKKVGKAQAEKIWARLKPTKELAESILRALQLHKTHVFSKNDPMYTPHPSTWLNQRRWQDEVMEVPLIDTDKLNVQMKIRREELDALGERDYQRRQKGKQQNGEELARLD